MKKCSTAQRFIRKEVTYYKIHILVTRISISDSTILTFTNQTMEPIVIIRYLQNNQTFKSKIGQSSRLRRHLVSVAKPDTSSQNEKT